MRLSLLVGELILFPRAGDVFATVTWSYIEITVGVMVACLPGARLFVARYVSSLRTTGSKFSKSLSRSGNCVRLSQDGGNDVGTSSSRKGLGSGPSIEFPADCERLPSSSQSAREDGDSQLELVIMTMEGDCKDEQKCHAVTV